MHARDGVSEATGCYVCLEGELIPAAVPLGVQWKQMQVAIVTTNEAGYGPKLYTSLHKRMHSLWPAVLSQFAFGPRMLQVSCKADGGMVLFQSGTTWSN